MPDRSADWQEQARHDLEHARGSLGLGHHDWACFAAQQAAEKAAKALLESLGAVARGHRVSDLLDALKALGASVPTDLRDAALELDKHYIPTRYPNGLASGAPAGSYTQGEAQRAIAHAEQVLRFCHGRLAGP